jgi:hypothetical protein
MENTYILQLFHSGLVGLLPTQHVGSVAVAVLCVAVAGEMLLSPTAQRVVLLGNVLGEVRRNHLFDLCRSALVHEGVVLVDVLFPVLSSAVSDALAQAFMVVAKHEGGVGIMYSGRVIAQDVRMLRNGRAPGKSSPRRSAERWRQRGRVGCARSGDVTGI